MPTIQADHPAERRLRLVFSNKVFLFGLAADATLGEIAQTLDALSLRHFGHPVAIDVTEAPCSGGGWYQIGHKALE